MTSSVDSISYIGAQYLGTKSSVNNGDFINLLYNITNSISVNFTSYVSQLMFNSSLYAPIYSNRTYQLNNLTAVNNPNLLTTGFSIFWLCTFFILLFVLIILAIFQSCKGKQIKRFNESGVIRFRRHTSKPPKPNAEKKILVFFIILSTVLWVIFFCLLCIEQGVVSSKISGNQSSNSTSNSSTNSSTSKSSQYSSVGNAISLAFSYYANMYQVITVDSLDFINSSVINMNTTLTNQIFSSIQQFGNSILSAFQVSNVFNDANSLLNSLNSIVPSMTYIYNNYKSTFSTISQTKGSISVYQQNIAKSLQTICNSLSSNPTLQATCISLNATNQNFQTLIDTTQINTDPSVIMLFFIQQYSINLTSITSTFQSVNTTLQNKLTSTFQTAVNSVNIGQYLNPIVNLWQSLIPQVTKIYITTSNYNSTASSYLNQFYTYENIILILIIILIFITIFMVLFSFFRESFYGKKWNVCANFSIQFFVLFFAFLSAIVAIALLIMSNYISSEICQQFNTTNGTALSDQMINDKLQLPWQQFVTSFAQSLTIGNNTKINLPQPTNLISAISTRCRNSSIGFLAAVGMQDFVNVSQIIQSSGIYETINKTQSSSFNDFLNVNPQSVIPSDILTFINQTKTLISFFDSVNYTSSLQQLSIPLLGIVNYQEYFSSLLLFAQNASKVLGNTNEISDLIYNANTLISYSNNYLQTQSLTTTMRSNYQNLQLYRNNSQLMNQLLIDINNVNSFFANNSQLALTYNNIFTTHVSQNMVQNVIQTINNNFTSITNQIMPCGNLSLIMESVTTSLCSSTNLTNNIATLGLILIMITVVSQVLSILIMTSAIIRLRLATNVSQC